MCSLYPAFTSRGLTTPTPLLAGGPFSISPEGARRWLRTAFQTSRDESGFIFTSDFLPVRAAYCLASIWSKGVLKPCKSVRLPRFAGGSVHDSGNSFTSTLCLVTPEWVQPCVFLDLRGPSGLSATPGTLFLYVYHTWMSHVKFIADPSFFFLLLR